MRSNVGDHAHAATPDRHPDCRCLLTQIVALHDALARELAEEGNFRLDETPELFGLYFHRKKWRRGHVVLYAVRRWHQLAPPEPGLEIVAHCFTDPHALPEDATSSTRQRCAEFFDGAPRSPFW